MTSRLGRRAGSTSSSSTALVLLMASSCSVSNQRPSVHAGRLQSCMSMMGTRVCICMP